MKRKVRIIKHRAEDDWYDDEAPWLYTGTTHELSDDAPRFRSVSRAAHHALKANNRPTIGFHKPPRA